MADPFQEILQDDFSAGAFPLIPDEKVPQNGMADAVNILLNDEGLPYKRGGSVYKSNAVLGSGSLGTRMIFDALLAGGQRTVWGWDIDSGVNMHLITLGADDATPLDLCSAGYIPGVRFDAGLFKPVVVQGMAVFPDSHATGALSPPSLWAGSRGGPATAVGTVTATKGSDQVTGTALDTKYVPGQFFGIGTSAAYPITAVTAGALTLSTPFRDATVTGTGLRADYPSFGGGGAVKAARIYASVAGRLLCAIGDTVYESAIGNPFSFADADRVAMPAGINILGLEPIGNSCLIFTTAGVWLLSNLNLNLTDASGNVQQRLDQVNRDLILWGPVGVANWGSKLVVPMTDDVYLIDGISAPRPILGGMAELYRSYVAAGHQPGFAAVWRGHYFLPVMTSATYGWVDTLVCRLTPNQAGRGQFAWTRLSGDGARMAAFAQRQSTTISRSSYMLGGHFNTNRLYQMSYFDPSSLAVPAASVATDADGSAHVAVLTTRAYRISEGIKRFFSKFRLNYELTDPAATNPTIAAAYSDISAGGTFTALSATAPKTTSGPAPFAWVLRKRGYGFKLRFTTQNAASRFLVRSVRVWGRQGGRN